MHDGILPLVHTCCAWSMLRCHFFRRMNSFINTNCFHLRSKVRSVAGFMFQVAGTVTQVTKDGNIFEMHALKQLNLRCNMHCAELLVLVLFVFKFRMCLNLTSPHFWAKNCPTSSVFWNRLTRTTRSEFFGIRLHKLTNFWKSQEATNRFEIKGSTAWGRCFQHRRRYVSRCVSALTPCLLPVFRGSRGAISEHTSRHRLRGCVLKHPETNRRSMEFDKLHGFNIQKYRQYIIFIILHIPSLL